MKEVLTINHLKSIYSGRVRESVRVFTELPEQCDITAQMFALGDEKKEIADKKCRSLNTIVNQLRMVFEVLNVRNGRELSILLAERIMKPTVAVIMIFAFTLDYSDDLRRTRLRRISRGSKRMECQRYRRREGGLCSELDLLPILT